MMTPLSCNRNAYPSVHFLRQEKPLQAAGSRLTMAAKEQIRYERYNNLGHRTYGARGIDRQGRQGFRSYNSKRQLYSVIRVAYDTCYYLHIRNTPLAHHLGNA